MFDLAQYSDNAIALMMGYGPRLILAIVTLFVGLWIIKGVVKALKKAMEKSSVDLSLQKFLSSLVRMVLKALLFISVISMVGVQMTSFIAVLGAAGLAVGLSLQGSLSNFAGGVLILLFKPFKVGDYIEAQGYAGKVKAISVFTTILTTPDNKTIIIPNGGLSNSSITNYSTEENRRVDMVFGISYSDDIPKAKDILRRIAENDSRVMKDPAPMIVLSELGDSSVNFATRFWCNGADYWGVFFDTHEKVKMEFDREGISIPFPQRDVHVYNH